MVMKIKSILFIWYSWNFTKLSVVFKSDCVWIMYVKLSFVLRRKYRKNIIKSFDGGRQEPSGISCWTDSICKSYTLQAKLSLNWIDFVRNTVTVEQDVTICELCGLETVWSFCSWFVSNTDILLVHKHFSRFQKWRGYLDRMC